MMQWKLFVGVLLLVFAGCSTTDVIDDASELKAALADKDRSIVFGRLCWMEEGKEQALAGLLDLFQGPGVQIHLMRMEDQERLRPDLDDQCHFVWSLEPGEYLVRKIVYGDGSGYYPFAPNVAFTVPEKGRVYYVGTLVVTEFRIDRDLLRTRYYKGHVSVQNERRQEEARLRELGLGTQPIHSSLMRHRRVPELEEEAWVESWWE
jgi:hypothetical protein